MSKKVKKVACVLRYMCEVPIGVKGQEEIKYLEILKAFRYEKQKTFFSEILLLIV